ncbi:B-cell antigen receptor complex-associated protein beta chain [Acanthopagrus schlegelii]
MRWLLVGYCGLALINISVALNIIHPIRQKPRFYGLMTHKPIVVIYCLSPKQNQSVTVEWYKVGKYDEVPENRKLINPDGKRIVINPRKMTTFRSILQIFNPRITDTGVYFCKLNDEWGPGTEVQVTRPVLRDKALYRSNIKDGLIVLQGLLLAVCIAAVLLHKRTMGEKSDSIYEEPETDHIYEGLAIETCGGGLYEELSVYAQPEGAEAPWE